MVLQQRLCSARVGGLWHVGDCVWDVCSEATWRERSSISSSSPAVTSNVEGEMLAVVARGVNAVGVVLYVGDGIYIIDGPSVKGSKISTGLSLSFGTRWRADDHGSLARLPVPSRNMESNSVLATAKRSGATRLG